MEQTNLAIAEKEKKPWNNANCTDDDVLDQGQLINVSGHVQEIDRTFGFWSICAVGICGDNACSLYNGGGPGVIYGLVASIFFYTFIALALAELSSALPSSANVYHWSSVAAGPRYGQICSWYAGWWNCLAWIFGAASGSLFGAEAVIAMYSLYHPEYVLQRWHVFIVFVILTWMQLSVVLFGQKILAKTTAATGSLMLLLFLAVTITCAIMPSQNGSGYASNAFVWTEWQNLTGWNNNGLVFLMGILNGAYAIGTPDAVAHLRSADRLSLYL
nr:choline transport protein [Quercus suber]